MNYKIKVFSGIFYLLLTISVQAQSANQTGVDKKVGLSLEGMIGFSANAGVFAINIGGPSLRLNIRDRFSLGVGALPSLYFSQNKTEPKLGWAPRIDTRRWAFFAPVYHFDNPDRWVWTFGAGYKFH